MHKELCGMCAEPLPETIIDRHECVQCGNVTVEPEPGREPNVLNSLADRATGIARQTAWTLRRKIGDPGPKLPTANFAALGLDDSWTGVRRLSGWGYNHGRGWKKSLSSVSLAHGQEAYVDGAVVKTYSSEDPLHSFAGPTLQLLWFQLGQDEAQLELVQSIARSDAPLDLWDPIMLSVNGVMADAFHVRLDSMDVLLADLDKRKVSVISTGLALDEIKLSNADLAKYTSA